MTSRAATMTIKRVQGRPARGERDVGRERLIEAVRSILRSRATHEVSRKAVADAAGVTPALVSYYFPDKCSLLDAATRPVFMKWQVPLQAILLSKRNAMDQIEELVRLFIEVNKTDGRIIDLFLERCRTEASDGPDRRLLAPSYTQLLAFLQAGMDAGLWRSFDPAFFLSCLWGMCKCAASGPPMACESRESLPAHDDATARQVKLIMDFVLGGIAAQCRVEPTTCGQIGQAEGRALA